ncbi:hypothetical protein H6A65_01260 [Mediterraneibacter glycyrrhizinilyticus]|uniref:hypothetical protein n=1 Tax=Mediterraneibacter glycyrrhizinilyticus TaxID=342942 RepID=UPI0019619ED1|nr:hypothetical protein [Mediterraneibacter glycyrrhizinilyticus]MBM6750132.1 hypothetical protein [Mediterraneibacter glycyrrhizinilyticus]
MIKHLTDFLVSFFYERECNKHRENKNDILPRYVLKHHIIIITNEDIVFDSNECTRIPLSIQYTIKEYGYPEKRRLKKNKPIVYKIDSTLSSIFPNELVESKCVDFINENMKVG